MAKQQRLNEYIALASGLSATAANFVDGIVAYCESFETFPERGTQRDDLLPGLRVTNYRKSTTVAFRVDAPPGPSRSSACSMAGKTIWTR
ncbi:MAG: type II toxin-antitoxin system RelE/ParE family toxin [Rhodanobacter sp.]